jgi:phosphoribosylanthranilate isomerase
VIAGIQVKVCGLTTAADAERAVAAGADYLGLIVHPGSPRYVPPERFKALAAEIGRNRLVIVAVAPTPEQLAGLAGVEARAWQIHFPLSTPVADLQTWSELLGPGRLWLAPRLPPAEDIRPEWLPLADTFLLDTFDEAGFGGTGRTGDWGKFARHAAADPGKAWILSGGLNPENVGAALAASGARFIDVNSGVEARPGVKDPAKLEAFAAAVARGRIR